MKPERMVSDMTSPLDRAAAYGEVYRQKVRPLHPSTDVEGLRRAFCRPLPEGPIDGARVIDELIAAAEPGLVGNTDPNFFAWVMGGSDPVGVAADWLTSVWGQNAAIYQTAPSAAIAEEAVAAWLLDLLDLPRDASVGLVSGATMATFVGLAAARTRVLADAGHDFEALGLQGAPLVRVFLSDDAHAANHAALRHLGFGEANIVRVPSDAAGLMPVAALEAALSAHDGPAIVIAQAGHINSGGFEDFTAISALARKRGAWVHVDGAFGLWARVLDDRAHLVRDVDLADSWSVDGHKWLQMPYDSGFAIVRDTEAHRRAMDISAGYLNQAPEDGRNPTEFSPGLSRRARGFAAWAVLLSLGRAGVRDLIAGHCAQAARIAEAIAGIDGLAVLNGVDLNQVSIAPPQPGVSADQAVNRLAEALNRDHGVFVRPAQWKGRTVLRLSIIAPGTDAAQVDHLTAAIRTAWRSVERRDP